MNHQWAAAEGSGNPQCSGKHTDRSDQDMQPAGGNAWEEMRDQGLQAGA